MRLLIVIFLIGFLLWIFSLGKAEKIGQAFIKLVINPIKELIK